MTNENDKWKMENEIRFLIPAGNFSDAFGHLEQIRITV